MEALKLQTPQYFELNNNRTGIGQQSDSILDKPLLLKGMKQITLRSRKKMIDEGGDWYNEKLTN